MIKITDKAFKEICCKIGIPASETVFLGGGREDSDGTVYTFDNGEKVLKILAIPESDTGEFDKLVDKVKFAGMLGDNGVSFASPLHMKDGSLYVTSLDNGFYYTAYVMDFCKGENPENADLTDELAYNWGKLTGKCHMLTRRYPAKDCLSGCGYKEEIKFFTNWCRDNTVKQHWNEIADIFDKLPLNTGTYGYIHNDNHQKNILVQGKAITLIDFDCATRQFFMHDITTPLQGLLFDETGGMISPLHAPDRLRRFYDSFINGYEKENHLDSEWYEKIELFINYRRLLLYTYMQDWVNSVPELKENFIKSIIDPPKML